MEENNEVNNTVNQAEEVKTEIRAKRRLTPESTVLLTIGALAAITVAVGIVYFLATTL